MKFIAKVFGFLKRKVAHVIFFIIRDNFDAFLGNSATLQNVQDLQRMISEGINDDRCKIKENSESIKENSESIKENSESIKENRVLNISNEESVKNLDIRVAQVQEFAEAINKNASDVAEFVNYSARELKFRQSFKDLPDIDYVAFERKFRGEEHLIKEHQRVFLPFFKGKFNVLDIGCGRGEFLELMKDEGINGTGIDIDQGMIDRCKRKGLNAIKADVFEFLDELKSGEVDGVFCSQVIEHFSFKEIRWILYILSQKLGEGGTVLFETINPRCLPALRMFYIDTTHVRPVDYEALAYAAENSGFTSVASVLSSPINPDLELTTQKLDHNVITQYGDYALIIRKK